MKGKPFIGHDLAGTYIVVEGIGGCGKTIQGENLVEALKRRYSDREVILTHEPGGTEKSEQIRNVSVTKAETSEEVVPYAEVFLFAASRCQAVTTLIRPVLERGGIVISDRSYFSSLCYQGYARELGWQNVLRINEIALSGTYPDKVFLPDICPELGLQRRNFREKRNNIYDDKSLEYFRKVREGYLFFAKRLNGGFTVIDGELSIEEINKIVLEQSLELIFERETQRELLLKEHLLGKEGNIFRVGKER